jgi:GntR family transcriptional repressor for pyruvate dehydrogenase complex
MPPRAQKVDVTARLLATFKQLISEGALVPGARLPAEREMANNLRVSRGSLRQVLKMLEIMGVVSQRVGDGTYLNAAAHSMLAEPMDARLIVEPELAARAATRASPEQVAALRGSLDRMGTESEVVEDDLRFHRTIFLMAENRVCSLMFSIVHESLHKLMEITSRMVDLEHTLRLHQRIYNAIRKGDPGEARARMFAHLTDAKELLTKSNAARMQTQLEDRLSMLSLEGTPKQRPARRRNGLGE